MEKSTCPVADHVRELAAVLEEERITVARCRQWAVDILRLMKDVASGRGGPEHFPAMTDLAEKLAGECEDPMSADLGNRILSGLREHKEVFLSHLETLNCPLGDCIELSPAPCQMACPAGIDVPGYVNLCARAAVWTSPWP
ncbi:MAG: hypothetical protein JRH05_10700 [Deltaproteobacteria bacterium]|nr:hypothetical protein [Deltaproteobacteria bacterium]